MVTVVPVVPCIGFTADITGLLPYIKPGRPDIPAVVVTTTFPEAPVPRTAVISVDDTTVKDVAGTPPKLTAGVPVKL
jgi:hypothetical protein